MIIEALSQGRFRTEIQALDKGHDPDHGFSLKKKLDGYSQLKHASSVFSNLTHISLSIPEARISKMIPAEGSPLAQLLSTTKSLKFLALEFQNNYSRIGNSSPTSMKRLIGKSFGMSP